MTFMKRYTVLAILLISVITAFAQSISVKSFKPLPMDMTASSLDGKRIDQNGEKAALIKIVTSETGFTFEGGTLGIVDTKQENGEIWVWVPRAARKITIKHQKLGVLRDYVYPVEIEAERTYEMVLTTAKIETIVKEEVRQQYLAFQINPANATLEVDDKLWTVAADGSAMKYVNFGTYTWRVQAPNYHADAGNVTVDDPVNSKIVTVTLRPNFGWIEVLGIGALQGASVYIDNAMIGRAPCKSEALKSGQHTVRIAKEMYDTYSETVTVNDNETTRLSPSLSADFAEVTLKVDAEAEIWVNNEKKGIRTWKGPLGSGTYKIECKQANHEPTQMTQEITANMAGQTITLPAPRPIFGSLMVESVPNFCKLYIDGKDMGTTPKAVPEILVGNHQVKLTKEGYADHIETVTVVKGERKQVNATLQATAKPVAQKPQPQNNDDNEAVNLSGSGTYNGHEYVDLGLPSGTLWATCNVGASKPEEYGNYYAWGETSTKSTYNWDTYKYSNGSEDKLTKYCNKKKNGDKRFRDNLTVLQASDDAATVNWGNGWCMPTIAQWEELLSNTTMTMTTQNGVNGRLFKASNGNSLFLPAAGSRHGGNLNKAGSNGYYRSSSLYTDSPDFAWGFYFYPNYWYKFGRDRIVRDGGLPIRAVRSSQN